MFISIANAIGAGKVASYISKLIKNFKTRVLLASGIFEAEACLKSNLEGIGNNILKQASLVITPNAYNAGTLFSVIPNTTLGDLDVVRATSATRVNANGLIEVVGNNVPRLDYTNASCPSILVEPQRTNLAVYSNDFTVVNWNKTSLTVNENTTISPNGTQDADTLTANGVNTLHFTSQNIIVNASTTYTISYFLKKGTNNFAQVTGGSAPFGADVWANFDLENGLIGSKGSLTTAKIENYGDGWYRCSITGNAISNSNTNTIGVVIISNSSSIRAEINSLSTSVYIWGAQFEAGSNATSYIPTTTTAVTRNADVISKSGISDLIGQTEGSIYCEFISNGINSNVQIFALSDGTTNERIAFRHVVLPNNFLNFTIRTLGVFVVNLNASIAITGQKYKMCATYSQTEQKLFVNGVLVATRTGSYQQPLPLNTVQLGGVAGNQFISNTSLNSALVFTNVLSDAEAIQLTTL